MSTIQGHFQTGVGGFNLDVAFSVPNRGITGIFGPSGAGKSTLLRCCAGLIRAARGSFVVGDSTWQDESAGKFLPVHARRVGFVFQDASLFSHLGVRENVLFGYKRIPAANRAISLEQAVAWTGIAPLLDRMPAGLSGGERQRVAIARALLSSPELLLMDEPMASLDETSRAELMPCLDALHRDLSIPIFLVNHSLREIARLSDTLVLVRGGKVVACGPLHSVLPQASLAEDDAFAILDATVTRHDETYALTEVHTGFGAVWAAKIPHAIGETIRIQIAARDVSLGNTVDTGSSILNQFEARVAEVVQRPPANMLVVLHPMSTGPGDPLFSLITRRSWEHLKLATGAKVYARVKGVSVLR